MGDYYNYYIANHIERKKFVDIVFVIHNLTTEDIISQISPDDIQTLIQNGSSTINTKNSGNVTFNLLHNDEYHNYHRDVSIGKPIKIGDSDKYVLLDHDIYYIVWTIPYIHYIRFMELENIVKRLSFYMLKNYKSRFYITKSIESGVYRIIDFKFYDTKRIQPEPVATPEASNSRSRSRSTNPGSSRARRSHSASTIPTQNATKKSTTTTKTKKTTTPTNSRFPLQGSFIESRSYNALADFHEF